MQKLLEFSHDELVKKLGRVTARLRPLFAACVAERLLPYAEVFLRARGGRYIETVQNALEMIWCFGKGAPIDEGFRQHTVDECMKIIEYAEEVDTEDSILASDTVAAIVYGLRAIGNEDPKEPAWAAQCAYDIVFRFAESQSAENSTVSSIEAHPIVQQELDRQLRDIEILKNLGQIANADVINNMREAARRQAQNIFKA